MRASSAEEKAHRLRVPVSDDDWSRGLAKAPVTLVEYVDYQCEHCAALYPVLEQLARAQRDKLRFVVRHFPVTSSHDRALDGALAAEAAGRQGRLWEMHARLFQNPGELAPDTLLAHARALALDLARFEDDLNDPELERKINEEKRQGLRSGVNGTPTLFINGMRYDGPRDFDALMNVVAEAAPRLGSGRPTRPVGRS